ncbi:MAG TPA: SRPBCC family protein [Anaerolineales bacterium]|nr:SRPBCC family protein [Anaerolineales bacterium]
MPGFELSEWIARPPKEVFDFVTDPNNAPKVVSSVKSMVKLTDGPTGKGTRYRETRLMNGKEQSAELEVAAFQPNEQYAVKNELQGFETIYTYNFASEKNGTRVKLVCEVKAGGLKKMMAPMVVSILKKEDGDHLQRLKSAMEGN